jgi:chromate transporter
VAVVVIGSPSADKISRKKIFSTFLKFGFLAWGGPVAQLALIREELVEKKKWISAEKFKKILAIYQILPGPEAHEMCVHIGVMKGGRIGGMLAGLGFMIPGFFLMLLLSFLYLHFGKAQLAPIFLFVVPVVTALIIRALHRIGAHVVSGRKAIPPFVAAVILTFFDVNFALIFLIAVIWEMLWSRNKKLLAILICGVFTTSFVMLSLSKHDSGHLPRIMLRQAQHDIVVGSEKNNSAIFLSGLKGGLTSFGGAYTTIPILQRDMVGKYEGVTDETFLDALAVSSIIPAPLIIFATFLGYIASGLAGAVLITIGMFLPAFAFSIIGFNYLEKIIENKMLQGILESIAAAVVGLFAVTALEIFSKSITSFLSLAIFAAALFLFYKVKKNWITPVLILTAGIAGIFY